MDLLNLKLKTLRIKTNTQIKHCNVTLQKKQKKKHPKNNNHNKIKTKVII